MEQFIIIGLISVIGLIPGPQKVKGIRHSEGNPQSIIYNAGTGSNTSADSFGTHTRVLRDKPVQANSNL
jgi:hypothetical protein